MLHADSESENRPPLLHVNLHSNSNLHWNYYSSLIYNDTTIREAMELITGANTLMEPHSEKKIME